jgi:hypothetical protein
MCQCKLTFVHNCVDSAKKDVEPKPKTIIQLLRMVESELKLHKAHREGLNFKSLGHQRISIFAQILKVGGARELL